MVTGAIYMFGACGAAGRRKGVGAEIDIVSEHKSDHRM